MPPSTKKSPYRVFFCSTLSLIDDGEECGSIQPTPTMLNFFCPKKCGNSVLDLISIWNLNFRQPICPLFRHDSTYVKKHPARKHWM
jgi:hypothetical protein